MTLHEQAIQFIREKNIFIDWPELIDLYVNMANLEPYGWVLGSAACQAVGGRDEQVVPVVAAYGCLQIAIILIDDLLDEDPRGLHHHYGIGQSANRASAYQAAGLRAIMQSEYDEFTKSQIIYRLNEMLGLLAYGQDLDVLNPMTEDGYWEVVRYKSSPYSSAALEAGALAGGADLALVNKIKQIGILYGEFMQIHDDLKDTFVVPANVDWRQGRYPLPLLFAELVDHPDRDLLRTLRSQVDDEEKLIRAQEILVRCGAGLELFLLGCNQA